MIGGVGVVAEEQGAGELGVGNDEVFREVGAAEELTGEAGDGGAVDEIGDAADGLSGEVGGLLEAEVFGTGHVGADGAAGEGEAVEDAIEERGFAAGLGEAEGVEDAGFEDVGFVDIGRAEEASAFTANVADVEGEAGGESALEAEIPVLDVGGAEAGIVGVGGEAAIGERDGGEGGAVGGDLRGIRQAEEAGGAEVIDDAHAGDVGSEDVEIANGVAFVADAVAGAEDGLVLAEPG